VSFTNDGSGKRYATVKNYRIVFMGTPDFAVPALHSLHAAGHEIALAVTQPDRPKGRGRKVEPPPVKVVAAALGVPVVQPATLRDEATLQILKNA
jgi:methionyl-tRNA formyltransferase